MGMNDTPASERIHIGFFGRRNAGKSSLVNAVTGQEMALVSDVKGTTTDPVSKTMELLPLGPVVIIDTPGFDDEGALGQQRVRRTRQTLSRTDAAVLVVDSSTGMSACDHELCQLFRTHQIPWVIAWNKTDRRDAKPAPEGSFPVCAETGQGVHELKEALAKLTQAGRPESHLVADLLLPGQAVVLVVPIDEAAPKGRLILPQQQVIRDILDAGASALVCRENELPHTLEMLVQPPAMVITDSQVFGLAAAATPLHIPLTSFSILMARYKGLLEPAVYGVSALRQLRPGDRILIAEGCTHHRQCGDIGTVKIPRWIREFVGFDVAFDTASGRDFPEDLTPYRLILHCGSCMLTEREMESRVRQAQVQGVPITNYGTAIAAMKGILHRSLSILPELQALLELDIPSGT